MNKELMELRKRFRGQTTKVEGRSFNNDPIPEAVYVGKVTRSEVKDNTKEDGTKQLLHKMQIRIEVGDYTGRTMFPFSPDLLKPDMAGIQSCAENIRAILGDVVPGKTGNDGSFELKVDAFLDEVENLAHLCEGELVEIQVKNQKARPDGSHLNREGKPRQNVYIRRGLGADGKAAVTSKEKERVVEKIDPGASMAMSRRRKPVSK